MKKYNFEFSREDVEDIIWSLDDRISILDDDDDDDCISAACLKLEELRSKILRVFNQ